MSFNESQREIFSKDFTRLIEKDGHDKLYSWLCMFGALKLWSTVRADNAARFIASFIEGLLQLCSLVSSEALFECAESLSEKMLIPGITECWVLHLLYAAFAKLDGRAKCVNLEHRFPKAFGVISQDNPQGVICLFSICRNANTRNRISSFITSLKDPYINTLYVNPSLLCTLDYTPPIDSIRQALRNCCAATTVNQGVTMTLFEAVISSDNSYESIKEYLVLAVRNLNITAIREILKVRPAAKNGCLNQLIISTVTHQLRTSETVIRCPWIHHVDVRNDGSCGHCQFLSHRPDLQNQNYGTLTERLDLFCKALLHTIEALFQVSKPTASHIKFEERVFINLYTLVEEVRSLYQKQPEQEANNCSGHNNLNEVCRILTTSFHISSKRQLSGFESLAFIIAKLKIYNKS